MIELKGTITRLVITHSLLSTATIDHLVIDVGDAVFLIVLIIIIVIVIIINIADLTIAIIVIELLFQVRSDIGTINVQYVSCCLGGDLVDAGSDERSKVLLGEIASLCKSTAEEESLCYAPDRLDGVKVTAV